LTTELRNSVLNRATGVHHRAVQRGQKASGEPQSRWGPRRRRRQRPIVGGSRRATATGFARSGAGITSSIPRAENEKPGGRRPEG